MARERWPKALRSSGANQRALRSVSGALLRTLFMTVRLLLERAGHGVEVASDGQKAVEAFERGSFDLLFLDIFMPGMDGIETMRRIHRQQPNVPIIVISGRPQDATKEPDFLAMAIKLGAVSSLPKPFKPAALL